MLNDLYRRARAEGMRASDAYRYAKYEPSVELEWTDYDTRATMERDGFTINVKVEPDDNTDLSWLGTFTDTYEDGAIKNPNHSSRTYEWFVPTYTVDERRADLHARGEARGVADYDARKSVQKDAAMAVDYTEYVIGVTVFKNGIELGASYLGGVGFGDDFSENQRYVAEVVDDMLGEALDEARQALRDLCK